MPTADVVTDYPLYLIHYNMFNKPWLYDDVLYGEYFWQYAKNTEFYDELKSKRDNYTDEMKAADLKAGEILLKNSLRIAEKQTTFKSVLEKETL